jgi:hypothetical protein
VTEPRPDPPGDPRALVAGGLLDLAGAPPGGPTVDEATRALRAVLGPSTLWARADRGADVVGDATTGGPAAAWAPPGPLAPGLAATLAEAWAQALAGRPAVPGLLRLTVADAGAADVLAAIGAVDGVRLVPLIARPALRFFWRWPLRIGVAGGPRAAAWRDQVASGGHAGSLYDVRVVGPDDHDDVEILVVDGDDPAAVDLAGVGAAAQRVACAVAVGSRGPSADLLGLAQRWSPAVAAGVVAAGAEWLGDVVDELSHDQPLDAALVLAAPDVRVAGDPHAVPLTAIGRWAAAAAGTAPDAVAADLRGVAATGDFSHESWAASAVVAMTRPLADAGAGPIVERAPGVAAAPPLAPPAAVTRHLLADVTRAGRPCRRVLAPRAGHALAVRIALPAEPGEGVPFAEDVVPAGDGLADLDVDVRCDELGLHAVQRIVLPTADRTQPSTVAVFPFETGAEGPLTLRIAVLHQGRFVQAAAVVASVRAAAVAGDRVQVVPLRLSSSPEPAAGTAADVSLDATVPGRIEHRGTAPAESGPVVLTSDAVEALLEEIEQRASAVFTEDDPGVWLDEEPTRSLLLSLARLGSRLRDRLDDLLIGDDARTIDVLVPNDAKVFPFELVYDGPAPRAGARLCRHARQPPRPGGPPCTRASTAVVCPYAFWGMHRTIIRTIQAPAGRRAPRPAVAPLTTRPILYAAAQRADDESPDDARPSDLLERALAGAGALTRVTSWTAWRKAVSATRPEMLVVLGHTDIADHEVFLEIGRRSHLRQADLDTRVVVADGAPPPLVVLLACASAVEGDPLGPLPATFTDRGAVAVVATLSKLKGPDGAKAAASVVGALRASANGSGASLGAALTDARRSLLADGLLIGLVLVAHGDVDLELVT